MFASGALNDVESIASTENGDYEDEDAESYRWNHEVIRQTCVELHTRLSVQQLKGRVLEEKGYLLKQAFDTFCGMAARNGFQDGEIIKNFHSKKLVHLKGSTIVRPVVDIMLRKHVPTQPDIADITAVMVRNVDGSNEPDDERGYGVDMARLAFLARVEGCRWAFYIWAGRMEDLKSWDLRRLPITMSQEEASLEFFLNKHLQCVPQLGKPLPSFCVKTVVQNQVTPELCVRGYRIEFGEEVDDLKKPDFERLDHFFGIHFAVKSPGIIGSWDAKQQLEDLRMQIKRARYHFEAGLLNRTLATLSGIRILFLELLSVKKLDKTEKADAEFLQGQFMHLKERIVKLKSTQPKVDREYDDDSSEDSEDLESLYETTETSSYTDEDFTAE